MNLYGVQGRSFLNSGRNNFVPPKHNNSRQGTNSSSLSNVYNGQWNVK